MFVTYIRYTEITIVWCILGKSLLINQGKEEILDEKTINGICRDACDDF